MANYGMYSSVFLKRNTRGRLIPTSLSLPKFGILKPSFPSRVGAAVNPSVSHVGLDFSARPHEFLPVPQQIGVQPIQTSPISPKRNKINPAKTEKTPWYHISSDLQSSYLPSNIIRPPHAPPCRLDTPPLHDRARDNAALAIVPAPAGEFDGRFCDWTFGHRGGG